MTFGELHIALDQEIQRVGSYQNDSFLPEELDHWLNKGVDSFISLNLNKAQAQGQTYEMDQEGLDNLRGLIKTQPITLVEGEDFASGNLPEDYRHYLSSRLTAEFCNDTIKHPCRLMSSDDFYYSLSNPYLRPKVYSPILRIKDEGMEVYTHESVTPQSITLDYLKNPELIDGANNPDTEFTDIPEHAHEAIVGITARRMTQSILPLDYNKKVQENILNQDT